jgi:Tat protein translocase TatB subunit
MFDIGIGEVFVMLVVALLVFGPDRLPAMARQAASFVRDLHAMMAKARRDLSSSVGDLGIDADDLKTLSDLRKPRSFVRTNVLDSVELSLANLELPEPVEHQVTNGDDTAHSRDPVAGSPPFDPDAT